ncbi:Mobile element protein [hydrothermal vent metagenome]|uniref:Mobile element protein n=1 Tax=hydrothermal vent metagenome TaxID=652676 RepID=A0A3B0SC00_9ZZZZ
MRKSRLSRYKQDRLIECFVSGSTARTAASMIGVNKSKAAYYFHRLREIITYELEQESDGVFAGDIEVNESYTRLRGHKLWW